MAKLRQVVKNVTGVPPYHTDQQIIRCVNHYFPACDFFPVATSILYFGIENGLPWEIVRWKFARGQQDNTVLTMRYKVQSLAQVPRQRFITTKVLLQRRFTMEYGSLIANHDYLVLPKKLWGNGTSRVLNGIMYEFYNHIGVQLIRVYAGLELGGYAWAKAGFHAVRKKEVYDILALNRKRVANGETEILSKVLVDKFQFIADGYYQENPDGYFPMYRWAIQPGGKEFLSGTDWHGELNLQDLVQRSIFETYLQPRNT